MIPFRKIIRSVLFFISGRADTFIALSSMFVAVAALYITVTSTQRSERLEQLRWQPMLALDYSMHSERGFSISLNNRGLGPAKVKWVQFYLDETLLRDWDDLYKRISDSTRVNLPHEFSRTFGMIYPEQVLPGDGDNSGYNLLMEDQPMWNSTLLENSSRISLAICYCSLLGECNRLTWSSTGQLFADRMSSTFPTCNFEQKYERYFHLPKSYITQ